MMKVHFFTEYHDSTEYGQIAKGCEEESTIKDETHPRRGHNIHRVVSFIAETDLSGNKEVKRHNQTVIPIIRDELRQSECHVVNEQVLVMHIWK